MSKDSIIDNGMTQQDIFDSLNSKAGSKFDPEIVKTFIEIMS